MGIFNIIISYRARVPLNQTKTTIVFREFPGTDLDAIWHKLERKCQEKWGRDLEKFECMMVSKRSGEYKAFLAQQEQPQGQPAMSRAPMARRGGSHLHPFATQEMNRKRQ